MTLGIFYDILRIESHDSSKSKAVKLGNVIKYARPLYRDGKEKWKY